LWKFKRLRCQAVKWRNWKVKLQDEGEEKWKQTFQKIMTNSCNYNISSGGSGSGNGSIDKSSNQNWKKLNFFVQEQVIKLFVAYSELNIIFQKMNKQLFEQQNLFALLVQIGGTNTSKHSISCLFTAATATSGAQVRIYSSSGRAGFCFSSYMHQRNSFQHFESGATRRKYSWQILQEQYKSSISEDTDNHFSGSLIALDIRNHSEWVSIIPSKKRLLSYVTNILHIK